MDFFGFVRDIHIWFSFLGFDRRARAAWKVEADRIFSTSELDNDLEFRQAELQSASHRMWGAEIDVRESEAQRAESQLGQLRADLALSQRDFRSELDEAYSELEQIKDEQRTCRDELSEAHEALNEARHEISSWHRKSSRTPWLFGNAGRELPKHSLFGQSFGDLDALKEDRAAAVEAIREASSRRAHLNASFEAVLESIGEIKRDRQKMFELRKAGLTSRVLSHQIAEVREFSEKSRQHAAELRTKRAAWETRERKSRGIEDIEARIGEIRQLHQEYLARFDSAGELAKRKAQHRADWLRERGISVPANDPPRD
jgi:chromosome segregation ATPase